MASRKLTFTIPSDLASEFLKRVPAQDRSRYVADALAAKLRERDRRLIRACEVANADPDVLQIEQDFDGLADDLDQLAEAWDDAPSR